MGFRWDKYEAWRKHPMLSNQLGVAVPGLKWGAAAFAVYVAYDMLTSSSSKKGAALRSSRPAFSLAAGQATYYNDSAALYADPKIRLHYPPELYERVYAFAGPATEAALDVACGTGQCAAQLAKRYKQVWAVDANEEQLKQCKPQPNITFKKGCAEKTDLPSSSLDLVTVATALHWFDVPAFYKEARRVLKPEGAMAAWCYYFPQIKHHEEANTIFQSFRERFTGAKTTDAQSYASAKYKGLEPGPEHFGLMKRDEIPFVQESTVWHLVAFCRTGGAYTKMRRENPEMPDPLPDLQRELLASLKTSDEYTPLELQCDIFMILAKEPKPL